MKHSDLRDVRGHMLDFEIVLKAFECQLVKIVDCRMANDPLQSLEHVPLHLGEHFFIIKVAAHFFQLSDGGHILLPITVFCSNEECRASDELIVPLVYHPFGAVAVEEVDGKKESFWEQIKGSMSFN